LIKAELIAHSQSAVTGKEMYTFEVEFPRIILAENNTHRMLSKNCASTRAIPIQKQIELIDENMFYPSFYGKKQAGMSATVELGDEEIHLCNINIAGLYEVVREVVLGLDDIGLHKQITGRYLEPFMNVKAVISGTEFDNFFWLRMDKDAQPEIKELAEKMWEAKERSTPVELNPGDWHVPYFGAGYWLKGCGISLEDALKTSASCCAQVSYRKLDGSLEKAEDIYDKLIGSGKPHGSPFEHQSTPMKANVSFDSEPYVTSYHRQLGYMSGNLAGWVQHRQMIPNNTCWDYNEDKDKV